MWFYHECFQGFLITKIGIMNIEFKILLISLKLTMMTNKPWFNMKFCLCSLTHTQSSASFLHTENLIVSHLVFCSLPALIYLQHSILPFLNWKKKYFRTIPTKKTWETLESDEFPRFYHFSLSRTIIVSYCCDLHT